MQTSGDIFYIQWHLYWIPAVCMKETIVLSNILCCIFYHIIYASFSYTRRHVKWPSKSTSCRQFYFKCVWTVGWFSYETTAHFSNVSDTTVVMIWPLCFFTSQIWKKLEKYDNLVTFAFSIVCKIPGWIPNVSYSKVRQKSISNIFHEAWPQMRTKNFLLDRAHQHIY